ncbi:MAG: hypothetical protein SFU86_09225 [Pirellulaceae bacterium]|nr:hypothetical protein [Pirellulaceae bacterium]
MQTSDSRFIRRCPRFAKLQKIAAQANKRFRDTLSGFDLIGLNVGDGPPESVGGYWCSPINSKCFADTGGEGVHFSFMCEEEDLDFDNLPVIVTIPAALGASFVVGENLYEFLCLGCHRGFFALEQLGHQLEKTLRVYATPTWKAKEDKDWWVGFGTNETQCAVLKFLRGQMGLKQWPRLRTRFRKLQQEFAPRIRLREEATW